MTGVPRILVVDDEVSIGRLFHAILTGAGYEVAVYRDPEGALRAALKRDFDLIITDFVMEPLDGLELVRALREKGVAVPVLLVTASFHKGVVEGAKAAGIEEVLAKPVTSETLLRVVRRMIGTGTGRPKPGT